MKIKDISKKHLYFDQAVRGFKNENS